MASKSPSLLPAKDEWPAWMRIAEGELGVRELPGPAMHRRIGEYYRATTLGSAAKDDSVPWCASFVSWVLEQAGYRSTRRANARSYLDWGEKVRAPDFGDIVVMWRGDIASQAGHVGFFGGFPNGGEKVWLLSGNSSNCVCWALYPTSRILGYRRPKEIDRKEPT